MSKISNAVKKAIEKYRRNHLFKVNFNDSFTADKGDYYDTLTEGQKKEIKAYWGKYIKLCKKDYNIIAYYNHCNSEYPFSPKYVPDYYFYVDIKTYLNNQTFADSFDNKSYYPLYLPKVNMPKNVLSRIDGGQLLDEEFRPITSEEFYNGLDDKKKYIFKPSVLLSGGKGIFTFTKDSFVKVEKSLKEVKNFVIQEFISQCEELKVFKNKSVNTIRVYSLYINGQIEILGSCLRIGLEDAEVDNFCFGGVYIPINSDGTLTKCGFTHNNRKIEELNGIKFDGFKIPSYDKVLEIIKIEGLKLPKVRFIGWDFAINENKEPTFIEFNLTQSDPDLLNVITHGEIFKEHTEEILNAVFKK